jgi:Undecaprenyl-phosphate galactose phosphotransferase WbaP
MKKGTLVAAIAQQPHVKNLRTARWETSSGTMPLLTIALIILSDTLSLLVATGISIAFRYLFAGGADLHAYLRLWPFLSVFLVVYGAVGLYPAIGMSPPDELRRVMISSVILFYGMAAVTMAFRGASRPFTPTLVVAVALSVVLLPLMRALTRQLFAERAWWGYPAVIFGRNNLALSVIRTLRKEPELGLKPVAVVDPGFEGSEFAGLPVVGLDALGTMLGPAHSHTYAMMTHKDRDGGVSALEANRNIEFQRLIYIADIESFCMWAKPRTLGGLLGLEVRQLHLSREMRFLKRVIDVMLTLMIGGFALPFIALIAAGIALDSPGPVFFGHSRLGRGGRSFKAWKFRTMVPNAEEVLESHLQQNPDGRLEWERDQKLRDDPRVTRLGRYLRKFSLDELPQLWNVLRGEMSLVGPRPIIQAEVPKYGSGIHLYNAVSGGLTGLWQVSGRNDTSYDERVRLDCFYVRNWSVFLDLCILFRTLAVVLLRKGAY